ncbi:MAG: hypothetical protein Q4C73_03400, partial [Eubacteriales bacterium]|nr:hypothetical protein [Eubacteriales bacterium]
KAVVDIGVQRPFGFHELVLFLCGKSFVETFFERALRALRAAVTDVRRTGKLRADVLLIKRTGGRTFPAGPAIAVLA